MRLDDYTLSVWTARIRDTGTGLNSETVSFVPDQYFLFQNYPNPFNPNTTISYQLPEPAYVIIKVYNLLGNEIQTLFKGYKAAGVYEINFDGKSLSSGIYLYRIDAGNFHQGKKMVLVK